MNAWMKKTTKAHTWCTYNDIYYFELVRLEKKCIKCSIIIIMKIPAKPNTQSDLSVCATVTTTTTTAAIKTKIHRCSLLMSICVCAFVPIALFSLLFLISFFKWYLFAFWASAVHNMCKCSVFPFHFYGCTVDDDHFFPHIHIFILTCTAFCKNVNTFSLAHLIPSIIISLCEVIRQSNAQYVCSIRNMLNNHHRNTNRIKRIREQWVQ